MIKYDKEAKLSGTNYPTYVSLHYPVIIDIQDSPGASVLICGPAGADKMWITGTIREQLIKTALESKLPQKIYSAPNPQFSESFILKLVAITKDSQLSKELNL